MRKREIERQRETVLVICPVKHIGSPQDEQEREREEREREREREREMDGTNLCNDPQKKEYFHNNKVKLFKISNPECTVKKQKRDLLSKILGHVQTQC